MDTTHVTPPASTATTTYLRAWPDDVVAQLGWPVHSSYTEHCLVSVLGPTSTLLLRLLAFELLTAAEDLKPVDDLEAISRSLGLGSGSGRNSKLAKALLRLVQFGYLKPFGGAVEGYWVRTHVTPLSERQLDRAGPRVRQLHDHLVAGKTDR
jgi:hypothetical protein